MEKIKHEELLEDISLKLTFDLDPQNQQEQNYCALAAVKLTNLVERNNLYPRWQAIVDSFVTIAKKNKKLSVFDVMEKLKLQLASSKTNTNGFHI